MDIGQEEREKASTIAAEKAMKQASKRKKIPWEEDGCLEPLMEWMTTEGNYAGYCGGNGNKGKTKTQHHKELAILVKEKHPSSKHTEKDAENKIISLKRQFRVAPDWANNTGQGVDNPGNFEAAILKYCPLFEEVNLSWEIDQRPSLWHQVRTRMMVWELILMVHLVLLIKRLSFP